MNFKEVRDRRKTMDARQHRRRDAPREVEVRLPPPPASTKSQSQQPKKNKRPHGGGGGGKRPGDADGEFARGDTADTVDTSVASGSSGAGALGSSAGGGGDAVYFFSPDDFRELQDQMLATKAAPAARGGGFGGGGGGGRGVSIGERTLGSRGGESSCGGIDVDDFNASRLGIAGRDGDGDGEGYERFLSFCGPGEGPAGGGGGGGRDDGEGWEVGLGGDAGSEQGGGGGSGPESGSGSGGEGSDSEPETVVMPWGSYPLAKWESLPESLSGGAAVSKRPKPRAPPRPGPVLREDEVAHLGLPMPDSHEAWDTYFGTPSNPREVRDDITVCSTAFGGLDGPLLGGNSVDGATSTDSAGRRRGQNGFAYFGLPPDSHDAWRNTKQERKVMRRHAAMTRTWSDEDLLRRQIQRGEEARAELEAARRDAVRREREAAAELARERASGSARLEEACGQAEIKAVRGERIRAREEKQREWNELNRDYPVPDYLKDYVNGGVHGDADDDAMADRFVNIGITGQAGTGKSSLIAKMMSHLWTNPAERPYVSFEADGTTRPTPYVVPGLNDRVRLWDLPGQGTDRFPSVSYLRDMGLKYFDALLVATDGRWKCDDSMLVDAIRFAGIWFRVVRTKADLAVESGRYDHGIGQEEALEQARTRLREQLINVTNPDMIYLVTTRSHFWSGRKGAPFGLVSTLCDEITGFLENRVPSEC